MTKVEDDKSRKLKFANVHRKEASTFESVRMMGMQIRVQESKKSKDIKGDCGPSGWTKNDRPKENVPRPPNQYSSRANMFMLHLIHRGIDSYLVPLVVSISLTLILNESSSISSRCDKDEQNKSKRSDEE